MIYVVQTWNLPDGTASGFIIALQIGLTMANLFFGFLADREGHKINLEIGWLLNVLAIAITVFAPGAGWFFLTGVVSAVNILSGMAIVYEFTDAQNRPTYIGLANTILGVAVVVASLFGGWLTTVLSYRSMFILAAIIGSVSWTLLRFTVIEPRGKRNVATSQRTSS